MTTREQVAHLLRRFGFGASRAEVEFYEKLGVDGTIERLIHYEKYPLGFTFDLVKLLPKRDGAIQINPVFVGAFWTARCILTERPLEEKLTLFWHDHFAVSASKVNNPFMMMQYVDTLRKHANGNFRALLEAVSKDPAMMFWLDSQTNVAGKPNENFAREVMELFTLGIGNYTEEDIQEAARAFTGWAWRPNPAFRRARQDPAALEEALSSGEPLFEFADRIPQHDRGEKTIFGKTGAFRGDDVLKMLLERDECPKLLAQKLWEWFAYMNPEEKIVNALASVVKKNGYEIKPTIEWIAQSDEFWSEKCVRKLIKNPADFCIPLARQFDFGALAKPAIESPPENTRGGAFGGLGSIYQAMARQGMHLLYPPDVAGWDWGEAWISTNTVIERIRFADVIASERGGPTAALGPAMVSQGKVQTSAQAVDLLLEIVDATIPPERKNALNETIDASGGIEALSQTRTAGKVLNETLKVLFAAPEFHLC